eukprot:Skav205979  [mRNA]  locus=scaffold442:948801:972305:- [translate_table: standard]
MILFWWHARAEAVPGAGTKGLPEVPVDGWLENQPKQNQPKLKDQPRQPLRPLEDEVRSADDQPPNDSATRQNKTSKPVAKSPIMEARDRKRDAKLKVEREMVRLEQARDIEQQLLSPDMVSLDPALRPEKLRAQVVSHLEASEPGRERRAKLPSKAPRKVQRKAASVPEPAASENYASKVKNWRKNRFQKDQEDPPVETKTSKKRKDRSKGPGSKPEKAAELPKGSNAKVAKGKGKGSQEAASKPAKRQKTGGSTKGRADKLEEGTGIISEMKFQSLKLHESLRRQLDYLNFTDCTPIQCLAIPRALSGKKDVMLRAPTGSGKTLAFLLPVIHQLLAVPGGVDRRTDGTEEGENGLKLKGTLATILSPTKELALQTLKVATDLCRMAYRSFPRELRSCFPFQQLHLGHLATSFGLREAPREVVKKERYDRTAADEEGDESSKSRKGKGKRKGAGKGTGKAGAKGAKGGKGKAGKAGKAGAGKAHGGMPKAKFGAVNVADEFAS